MPKQLTTEQQQIVDALVMLYLATPPERHDRLSALIGETYVESFKKAWPQATDDQIRANLQRIIEAAVARERQIRASGGGRVGTA